MDEAFLVVFPARPGEPGYGDQDVRFGAFEAALRHCQRDIPADRPAILDQLALDSEQVAFGCVGIGDETALERMAAARDIGQQRGKQTAGAAFGGRQSQFPFACSPEHGVGQLRDAVRESVLEFFGHVFNPLRAPTCCRQVSTKREIPRRFPDRPFACLRPSGPSWNRYVRCGDCFQAGRDAGA